MSIRNEIKEENGLFRNYLFIWYRLAKRFRLVHSHVSTKAAIYSRFSRSHFVFLWLLPGYITKKVSVHRTALSRNLITVPSYPREASIFVFMFIHFRLQFSFHFLIIFYEHLKFLFQNRKIFHADQRKTRLAVCLSTVVSLSLLSRTRIAKSHISKKMFSRPKKQIESSQK